jgi:uncharacterized membrane protein (UPF0127 family)
VRAEVVCPDARTHPTVSAELAITDAEREKGLQHRTHLNADEGMLFVLDVPETRKFWMKNTLLPLDLVFIDQDGVIVAIRHGEPMSEVPVGPDQPVKYVLEVASGWALVHGVRVGQRVQLREVHS